MRPLLSLSAGLAVLDMPHAELIIARQRLEDLSGAECFRFGRRSSGEIGFVDVDIIFTNFCHSALVACRAARSTDWSVIKCYIIIRVSCVDSASATTKFCTSPLRTRKIGIQEGDFVTAVSILLEFIGVDWMPRVS